jgi:two-component system alkaline phosphatase synthesis response regulator PhoP
MMEPQANVQTQTSRPQRRPQILVADDEEPILRLLEMKFTRAGFDVVTARDGREAWEKALQHRPDLVLTDYRMPYVDGLELCTKLLVHPNTHDVPVIVITSPWCKIGNQLRQLRNVAELVEKPLSPRELIAKVRKLTGCESEPLGPGGKPSGSDPAP